MWSYLPKKCDCADDPTNDLIPCEHCGPTTDDFVYNGPDWTCLEVINGMLLTEVIQRIDYYLCGLEIAQNFIENIQDNIEEFENFVELVNGVIYCEVVYECGMFPTTTTTSSSTTSTTTTIAPTTTTTTTATPTTTTTSTTVAPTTTTTSSSSSTSTTTSTSTSTTSTSSTTTTTTTLTPTTTTTTTLTPTTTTTTTVNANVNWTFSEAPPSQGILEIYRNGILILTQTNAGANTIVFNVGDEMDVNAIPLAGTDTANLIIINAVGTVFSQALEGATVSSPTITILPGMSPYLVQANFYDVSIE